MSTSGFSFEIERYDLQFVAFRQYWVEMGRVKQNIEIQYPLDDVILTLSNLLVYLKECLLSVIAEDSYSILPVLRYTFVASALLGLWYFLFWRPFDRNRVIK